MLTLTPSLRPSLERDFVPAALWNRAYGALVAAARPVDAADAEDAGDGADP